MEPDMQITYEKGEVVWAKIRGLDPWWPGVIAEVHPSKDSELKYLVNFIGDNSHSILSSSQVAKYSEKYQEFVSKIKNKAHKDSVASADQILKGTTTYESEVKRLQQRKPYTPKKISDSAAQRRKGFKSRRKFSSESEDRLGLQQEFEKQDSAEELDVQTEITELGRLLTENKLNIQQVEGKIQNLAKLIENSKSDEIQQVFQSPNFKTLIQIQKSLEQRTQNGTRNLAQANSQISQLIEKLKTILLKLVKCVLESSDLQYFDPTEIIQHLHHVSGQKKITQKLLEKLSSHPDLIFDQLDESDESDDEEDSDSSGSNSPSESGQRAKRQIKYNQLKIEARQKASAQNQKSDKLKRGGKKIKKMTKLEETSPVANPELSKEVYQKVLQQISDAFDNQMGRRISLEIERRLRQQDPEMGKNYRLRFQRIIDNLKKIRKNELNEMVTNSCNYDKLWNLINQGKQNLQQLEQMEVEEKRAND